MRNFVVVSVVAVSILLLTVGCGDSMTSGSNPDQSFVTNVALGGMTEVKLGELAVKNGSNKAVKDFGAKMSAEHGKANSELASLAAKKNWTMPTTLDSSHQSDLDKFSKLSGEAFDKEYIIAMVDDHEKDVKEVRDALQKINDPDLKKWAQSALETMQAHLAEIKAIKGS